MADWQPIETAPKDDTHIVIGYFPPEPGLELSGGLRACKVVFWHGIHQMWCAGDGLLYTANGGFSPTHWARLEDAFLADPRGVQPTAALAVDDFMQLIEQYAAIDRTLQSGTAMRETIRHEYAKAIAGVQLTAAPLYAITVEDKPQFLRDLQVLVDNALGMTTWGPTLQQAAYRMRRRFSATSAAGSAGNAGVTAAGWIKLTERRPEPGALIVKRWKSGSVWAGVYSGTDKDSSFDEWVALPAAGVPPVSTTSSGPAPKE